MPDGEPKHPYPSIQRINLRHEVSPPPANVKRGKWSDRFWWAVVYLFLGVLATGCVRSYWHDFQRASQADIIGVLVCLAIGAALWIGRCFGKSEPN